MTIKAQIEFNSDLDGLVITFDVTGHTAQTQYDIENNKLHADYGKKYLDRFTEYDDDLTAEEDDFVKTFVMDHNHELFAE